MTKGKKYDYRIKQDNDGWAVEIIRRKTAKETVVSKSQSGFSSELAAQEWGQTELETFLQNLSERNKLRAEKRNKVNKKKPSSLQG